jgi:hypothetical protein
MRYWARDDWVLGNWGSGSWKMETEEWMIRIWVWKLRCYGDVRLGGVYGRWEMATVRNSHRQPHG